MWVSLCRMCSKKVETVSRIISECREPAQREHKRRHENVSGYVYWELSGKSDLERAEKWYEHKPDGGVENEEYKILWDMKIQFDKVTEGRKPDLVFINKEQKEVKMIIAVPGDLKVKDKEIEKIEKHQVLKYENLRLCNLKIRCYTHSNWCSRSSL